MSDWGEESRQIITKFVFCVDRAPNTPELCCFSWFISPVNGTSSTFMESCFCPWSEDEKWTRDRQHLVR